MNQLDSYLQKQIVAKFGSKSQAAAGVESWGANQGNFLRQPEFWDSTQRIITEHSFGPAGWLRVGLLPMFGGLFLLSQEFAVVFRRSIKRVERIGQNEFVLPGLILGHVGCVLQSAQLGLEFCIGADDQLERPANIVFAMGVSMDVVVQ